MITNILAVVVPILIVVAIVAIKYSKVARIEPTKCGCGKSESGFCDNSHANLDSPASGSFQSPASGSVENNTPDWSK